MTTLQTFKEILKAYKSIKPWESFKSLEDKHLECGICRFYQTNFGYSQEVERLIYRNKPSDSIYICDTPVFVVRNRLNPLTYYRCIYPRIKVLKKIIKELEKE